MKNILKIFAITCLLSLSMVTSCFAYGMQLSDTYGAESVNTKYNDNIGATNYAYLQSENFGYTGMFNSTHSIYTSYVSDSNVIKYICNQAGYVDTIQVVSNSYELNRIESYVLLIVLTDGCDADSVELLTETSAAESVRNNWYCDYTGRIYNVSVFNDNGTITTTMYAFLIG